MFVLCTTGKRQPQWGDSEGNWLHKQQQEGTGQRRGGGGLATGDPIKIFHKHCFMPGQKKKHMDADDIISQEVLLRDYH